MLNGGFDNVFKRGSKALFGIASRNGFVLAINFVSINLTNQDKKVL